HGVRRACAARPRTQGTLRSTGWRSWCQKLTTAAASTSLPDVFRIGRIWTAPLAERGALLDLTDRVAEWEDAAPSTESMLADGAYEDVQDRKSTRLNSSHVSISYAVFCLKKKKKYQD